MYEKGKKKGNSEDNQPKMLKFVKRRMACQCRARIDIRAHCLLLRHNLQLRIRIRLRFKRIGCVFIPSVNLRLFSRVDKKLSIFVLTMAANSECKLNLTLFLDCPCFRKCFYSFIS